MAPRDGSRGNQRGKTGPFRLPLIDSGWRVLWCGLGLGGYLTELFFSLYSFFWGKVAAMVGACMAKSTRVGQCDGGIYFGGLVYIFWEVYHRRFDRSGLD